MKRTYIVNMFIALALGCAIGTFFVEAVVYSSMVYEIMAIIATIAAVLNVTCIIDTSKEAKK